MNFTALQAELALRGFDYLSATRQGQYINRGYHWVCEYAQWPFLYTGLAGAAPLTISDLREVRSVTDTTNNNTLEPSTVEDVRRIDPPLTNPGVPQYWYSGGSTQVRVWPSGGAPT